MPPEFLSSLPIDGGERVLAMCDRFRDWYKENARDIKVAPEKYETEILGCAKFISTIALDVYSKSFGLPTPETGQKETIEYCIKSISETRQRAWGDVSSRTRAEHFRQIEERAEELAMQFAASNSAGVFTEVAKEELRKATSELREKIDACGELGKEHKARLLRKLGKLELELDKYVSDYDRFIGMGWDLAAVIRANGEAAKSIVEPASKWFGIVVSAYCLTQGLPPPPIAELRLPLLPDSAGK